jgi:hypothetical protein
VRQLNLGSVAKVGVSWDGRFPERIAALRSLNRHVERVFDPDRKDHHWGKRKLAHDR